MLLFPNIMYEKTRSYYSKESDGEALVTTATHMGAFGFDFKGQASLLTNSTFRLTVYCTDYL